VQEEFPGGRIEEEVVSMKAECYAYIQVEKGGDFPWTSTMPSSVITLKVAREER
jgi:hypothetical protein